MSEKNTAVKAPEQNNLLSRRTKEKIVDFLLVLPALILLAIFTY